MDNIHIKDQPLAKRLSVLEISDRLAPVGIAIMQNTATDAIQRIKELEFENEILRDITAPRASDQWQHVKRGVVYDIYGVVKYCPPDGAPPLKDHGTLVVGKNILTIQCETALVPGEILVAYYSINKAGTVYWGRPISEFLDGRFIRLAVDDE